MVDKNFKKDMDKLVADGFITIDKNGEMKLTDKGMRHTGEIIKSKSSRDYMKKVAKHFNGNSPNKEAINIEDLPCEIDMVDNTKLSIYERFNIAENDDLKNYQLFCKILSKGEDEEALSDLKTDRLKKAYKNMTSLFNTQYSLLKEAKYFEVSDRINLLLSNTKNEVNKIRFPYYFTFIDTRVIIHDRVYYSFFVTDFDSFEERYEKKTKDSKGRINIVTFYETENGMGYENFNIYKKDNDKYRNKIREYLMNFVDFVNSEDIKLMFRERSEKNTQRRVERGRLPIPSFNKISVIGYLAKYLNKLESDETNTRFNHRFWVRGHFQRFWNKDRYKNMYKKFELGQLKNFEGKKYNIDEGVLRVWVYPYIKGEGMLINKGYVTK